MKLFYAIAILAQLAVALLFRSESKTAYLLYLWNNLWVDAVEAGRPPRRSAKESKSHAGDPEYSLFLER